MLVMLAPLSGGIYFYCIGISFKHIQCLKIYKRRLYYHCSKVRELKRTTKIIVEVLQSILNRLEAFAKQRGFFPEMQFVFHEGVGCIEASFVILETINHMLERGAKFSVAFLTFVKPLTPCGLTVYYTNYSQSWKLEAECS